MRSTTVYPQTTLAVNMSNESFTQDDKTIEWIKFVAYSIVAYVVVAVGIFGNLLSLVVLTRPNLKGVMYLYLLGLAASNLCVLVTAVPALYDISHGLTGGNYITAFYQAHMKLPLINSFMASSVYIIICMTVNRYISIYRPTHFQRVHTFTNAQIHIGISFLAGILLHIPLCFQNKVLCFSEELVLHQENCTWYAYEHQEITHSNIFKAYLVSSEILLRFGPILVLACLNTLIIYKFQVIAEKRQRLRGYSTTKKSPPTPTGSSLGISRSTELSNHDEIYPKESTKDRRSSTHPLYKKSPQSKEERVLVLVLISIVLLFVCCTTPAAILSIIFSVSLQNSFSSQIFRAIANNLELLNFALNFHIHCFCSAEIRRAFVCLLKYWADLLVTEREIV